MKKYKYICISSISSSFQDMHGYADYKRGQIDLFKYLQVSLKLVARESHLI